MKTKEKIIIALTLGVLGLSAHPAKATDWLDCPALSKDASYGQKRNALKYLVPGVENWMFISKKDFMTNFTLRDKSLQAFQDFQKKLREKGTEIVLVVVPQRGLVHDKKIDMNQALAKEYDVTLARKNYNDVITKLQQGGIPVAGPINFESITDYGHPRDHHWNIAGAKLITEKTVEKIKTLPTYETIKKENFILEEGQDIKFKGTFFIPVRDMCGTELPSYTLKEQVSISQDADLFNNTQPEIVFVGTSFSVQGSSRANFVGQLRAALSADIDNRAIGGGGVKKSLTQYLKSEDFKSSPAKILIWEIPGFYHLNREKFLNEMIQLVDQNE